MEFCSLLLFDDFILPSPFIFVNDWSMKFFSRLDESIIGHHTFSTVRITQQNNEYSSGRLAHRSLLYKICSIQRSLFHSIGESLYRSSQVNRNVLFLFGSSFSVWLSFSDYPCDLPSVLTLTLSNVGSPRIHIHELALRLMLVLCKGHLSESQPSMNASGNAISSSDDVAYILSLASNYSRSQMMLCEYLARRRPDLTMAMFSGKFGRRFAENNNISDRFFRNHDENFNGERQFTIDFIYDSITLDS